MEPTLKCFRIPIIFLYIKREKERKNDKTNVEKY